MHVEEIENKSLVELKQNKIKSLQTVPAAPPTKTSVSSEKQDKNLESGDEIQFVFQSVHHASFRSFSVR